MKKHWPKAAAAGVALLIVFAFAFRTQADERADLFAEPERGPFRVAVTTTGELKAMNSVRIMAPMGARQLGIYEMKVLRMVPEGTVVQEGDFVAELDRAELSSKLADAQTNIEKFESQYTQAALDSALTLSKARDDLQDLRYALEEAKLNEEQSAYEPPSVQRQVEINLEKAERNLERSLVNYETQVQQAVAKMREVEAELNKARREQANLQALANEFTVLAPAPGMVVHEAREGGTVRAWDPTIAELPDLTTMESVTYVNEVDIQKVQQGQLVEIGLDAIPDLGLTGVVTRVANIGETRPNADSKVFEVTVRVNERDSLLRPALTTSNTIIVAEIPDALHIPLEAVHAQDSLNYVFVRQGGGAVRQEVELGLLNENEVIVERGLDEDAVLYLSLPPDTTGLPWQRLEFNEVEDQLAVSSEQ